jgi:asparagine synthase (glutamine-hydrolysing)
MCGFLGYFSSNNILSGSQLDNLYESLELINHRGPDHTGVLYEKNYFLAHKRLSIIDLSDNSNQPIKNNDNNLFLLYNGEIYNYQELALKYFDKCYNSDTVFLFDFYKAYGFKYFNELRGMYAFAFYDSRDEKNMFYLGRDPSGIKPLYFYFDTQKLVFASEIKSIKNIKHLNFTINQDIIKYYLSLGYCQEPNTIYNEIKCLKPGFVYSFMMNSTIIEEIKIIDYCDSIFSKHNSSISDLENKLEKAVKRNLVSDVSLKVALSGGIDSSLILALAKNHNPNISSLTVKNNDIDFDESVISKEYARVLNISNDLISTNTEGSIEMLDKIFLNFDQPYADSSAIPFFYLTRLARESSKVLIGGDGGDELMVGYPSQIWLPILMRFKSFFPNKNLIKPLSYLDNQYYRTLNRLSSISSTNNIHEAICNWQSWQPPDLLYNGISPFKYSSESVYEIFSREYFTHNNSNQNISDNSIITYYYFYNRLLGDYLRKTDMISMYNSIEYRVPMLDEDFVLFSFNLDYKKKYKFLKTKILLRDYHKKYFPIYTSKLPKKGFTIPLDVWLSEKNFKIIKEIILETNSIVLKYISKDYVEYLFKLLYSKNYKEVSRSGIYQRILILYNLQIWFKNNKF